MLSIFTQYEMIDVWDTVSAHIHLPKMLLSTDYLYEKRIGQVTSDLLYILNTLSPSNKRMSCLLSV